MWIFFGRGNVFATPPVGEDVYSGFFEWVPGNEIDVVALGYYVTVVTRVRFVILVQVLDVKKYFSENGGLSADIRAESEILDLETT